MSERLRQSFDRPTEYARLLGRLREVEELQRIILAELAELRRRIGSGTDGDAEHE